MSHRAFFITATSQRLSSVYALTDEEQQGKFIAEYIYCFNFCFCNQNHFHFVEYFLDLGTVDP